MPYVAFLRAINTGNRRIKMAVLREAFAAAGYSGAATHLATGNVVFDADGPPDEAALEASLDESLGFANWVFIRTPAEIEALLSAVPWTGPGVVEVSFLGREPDPGAARALEATAVAPEDLVVVGREVLFLREGPPAPTTHKESTTERMLGTVTTRRGMATVQGIWDRYLS
mgnify:CR=1 FL=1